MDKSSFFTRLCKFPCEPDTIIKNVVCWNHGEQLMFAVVFVQYSCYQRTEIKNDKWETLYTIQDHSALVMWTNNNFLVTEARTRDPWLLDLNYLCLCSLDAADDSMLSNNFQPELFCESDHTKGQQTQLQCHWTRKYGAECCCIWNGNLCVCRPGDGYSRALIITSPAGEQLAFWSLGRATAMAVVADQLWVVEGMDWIHVYRRRSGTRNYDIHMKIVLTHSVSIVSICEFNKWAVLGTLGGYILLYDKFTGIQPKQKWGICVGLDQVFLTTWRGRLVTASGNTISFYDDQLELQDTIKEPDHLTFGNLILLDGVLYAAAKHVFIVYTSRISS